MGASASSSSCSSWHVARPSRSARCAAPVLLQLGLLRDKYAAKVGENLQLYNALLHAKRLLVQVGD